MSIMEDFPALPITEKKFETSTFHFGSEARSSASTTSIGACGELKTALPSGEYLLFDTVDYIRPSLQCKCDYCYEHCMKERKDEEGNISLTFYPTAENFGYCLRANIPRFEGNFKKCQVTNSKVIYHKDEESFSVSYIEYRVKVNSSNTRERRIRGWVKSKFLRENTFSSSRSVEPTHLSYNYVDRSRSPSVFYEPHFRFGDLVMVDTAEKKNVRGEVRQENPLMILVEGDSLPQPFHISMVKDHPTRDFITLKDLDVRRNKHRSDRGWGHETIEAGTTVKIAYMDGFEGRITQISYMDEFKNRITAPMQGWISMRDSAHSALNVLESDWVSTTETKDLKPRIIVNNLPRSITEKRLRDCLNWHCSKRPTTIEFQRKGNQFRAVVTFLGGFKHGSRLVQRGTLELHAGWNLGLQWEMGYLKHHAKIFLEDCLKNGFDKEKRKNKKKNQKST